MRGSAAAWPSLILLPALVLVSVLSTIARPDIVVLTNGNEIQGEVLKADERQVVVRFSGGILRLRRRDVREIQRQDRDQYLIEEGEKQLRRGDYSEAVKSFSEATRENSDSLRARNGLFAARLRLAVSLREKGRYQDAREALEQLGKATPGRDDVETELRVLDATLRKAREEEREAVAQLARGDVDGALGRLQKLYDRLPDRREELGVHLAEAIVRKGDLHFVARDWDRAAERYLAALAVKPDLLPAIEERFVNSKLNGLRALAEEGDFAALETSAREGLEVAPANGPLRYYFGLAMEGQGNARAAAAEYALIAGVRQPRNPEAAIGDLRRSAESKLVAESEVPPIPHPEANQVLAGEFRREVSRRFEIYHKNRKIAREVLSVAERVYDDLYRRLGCSTHLLRKIRITLFPDRDEYLKEAPDVASWSGGGHRVHRMGRLSQHEIACYQDQPGLLTETIPHEVAHSLLAHRLNYPEIPLWIGEGFAILVEPSYVHRYYARLILQELQRGDLLSLHGLTQRTTYPDDRVALFYGQSFSVVEYLIAEGGLETLLRFAKSLSEPGHRLDAALRAHYDLQGTLALENRWKSWLARRRGGR